MKRIFVALLLATFAAAAYAACSTTTVFTPDGRVVMCTTCCYNGNCTVTCF